MSTPTDCAKINASYSSFNTSLYGSKNSNARCLNLLTRAGPEQLLPVESQPAYSNAASIAALADFKLTSAFSILVNISPAICSRANRFASTPDAAASCCAAVKSSAPADKFTDASVAAGVVALVVCAGCTDVAAFCCVAAVASAIAAAVAADCCSSAAWIWAAVSALCCCICCCIAAICCCICCICKLLCCAAAAWLAAAAWVAAAVESDTNCAAIYSIKSVPYCLHDAFDSTHPVTIGRAISIDEHPPFAHFGWAQRNIIALQFPKSAAGADAAILLRGFMYAFHMALFVDPDVGLYAVKLLPTVVATGDADAPDTIKVNASNKNPDIRFIFSLADNFNIKITQ